MALERFHVGEEVAIVPWRDSPATNVVDIGVIAVVDSHTVQLEDHRMYSLQHRWGLTPRSLGFMVRATDTHRSILGRVHPDREEEERRTRRIRRMKVG
jgi:hypothetical protein